MASDTIFSTAIDKSVGALALDPTGNFAALGGWVTNFVLQDWPFDRKKAPASTGCILILDLKDDKRTPQKTFLFRKNSEITHVAWNQLSPNLLASTCNYFIILIFEVSPHLANEYCEIWDVHNTKIPLQSAFEAHQLNVSDLAWSKFDKNVLATCSGDTMVKQWDIR